MSTQMAPHNSTSDDAMGPQEYGTADGRTGSKESVQGAVQTLNRNDPDSSLKTEAEIEESIREKVADIGPGRSALLVYLGLINIAIFSVIGFFLLSWSWIVSLVTVFISFVIVGLAPPLPTFSSSFCFGKQEIKSLYSTFLLVAAHLPSQGTSSPRGRPTMD